MALFGEADIHNWDDKLLFCAHEQRGINELHQFDMLSNKLQMRNIRMMNGAKIHYQNQYHDTGKEID
jgi:hypothetical protein